MSSHRDLLTRAHPYLLELAAIDRARKMPPGEIPDLAKEIKEAIGSGVGESGRDNTEDVPDVQVAPGVTIPPNHIQCTECGTDLYLDSFTGDASIPAEPDPGAIINAGTADEAETGGGG